MTRVDLLRGRAIGSDAQDAESGAKLKWVAVGANPKGIIAIGAAAEGIVAIGANAVGVVAIGVNALGTLVAFGVNAVAPLAVSAVNSVGIFALSLINVIGGFGWALVNDLIHPVLGWLLLAASVAGGFKLKGRWLQPESPPLVPLSDLQAGRIPQGWSKVALLGTERRAVVVGNSDEQVALVAPSQVVQYAAELRDDGARQVLVHVEVTRESAVATAGDYRAQAERTAVLQVDELRRVPRRPLRPQDPAELRWLLGKSLWLSAALCAALMIALAFGWA